MSCNWFMQWVELVLRNNVQMSICKVFLNPHESEQTFLQSTVAILSRKALKIYKMFIVTIFSVYCYYSCNMHIIYIAMYIFVYIGG